MKNYSLEEVEKILEKEKEKVFYLEFISETCGDCIAMKPVVDEVVEHFKGNENFKFMRIDVKGTNLWGNPDTKWEVLRVPTHIVIKKGEIFRRGFEYFPKEILVEWIEEALK